jgi:Na+-transporting NADH:ubiquinone oxidoreductase subunit C
MDVNKNSYTFGFAAIMVIVVAVILSGTSIILKDAQDSNVELEKKQNILKSVGVDIIRDSSAIEYDNYIIDQLVLNHLGETQEGSAFDVDLSKEIKKDISEQKLPLYIAEVDDELKYIIPLRGKGLWGPIWGFISFNDDFNTVFAAVFDHKGETPGLGAEINKSFFQDPFKGKTILEEGEFVSITIFKGGAPEGNNHGVDAISGGTITSDGVTHMLRERLKRYLPYFRLVEDNREKKQKEEEVRLTIEAINIDEKRDSISNIGKRIVD